MKQREVREVLSWRAAQFLLRLLSFAVPRRQRESWRLEWEGEVWQARPATSNGPGVFRFLSGALPDAICLLREAKLEANSRSMSASRCLLVLASVTALATGIAFCLPRARAEFRQLDWKSPDAVSILFLPNARNEAEPTITPERFFIWKQRAHDLQSLGFYQIADRDVLVQGRSVRLKVAHVAGDLAELTGTDNSFRPEQSTRQDNLILSNGAWRRAFNTEPSGKGMLVSLDGRPVRISSVADLRDSGLPGDYDAWLFDNRPQRAGVPGFVIAHFAAGTATNPYFGFQHFSVRETEEFEISGLAFPLADRKVNPWYTLGLGLLLSLLALPATTPLGFGEKVRADGRASIWQVGRRLLFIAVKCVLWAGIAADSALVFASVFSRAEWRLAVMTRLLVAFAVMLIGLRWSIHDQRRRCPVCLKRLTNPATVGEPSRNFLSWNGIELVCESGHGLMHVPAHATSWFRTQRWLALDSSWEFLFAQKR